MTLALPVARRPTADSGGLPYACPNRREAVGRLADQAYSERLVRFVTVAPVIAVVGIVVVQLSLIWSYTGSGSKTFLAIALTVGYLPFHLSHVWAAAHARRPRGGLWTLAVMAVIIAAGTPFIGFAWLYPWVQVLVSVLIVLPRPWSWVVGGLLVVVYGPLNVLLHNDQAAPAWAVLVLLERTGATLVPAWFAGALHQLRTAREDIATRAVLRERVRIDGELARTVGTSLDDIATRSTRIGTLVGHDDAERELRALVDGSRHALAAARRLIRDYQRVSLRAELDTAAALLTASGIRTNLVLPHGELPDAGPELSGALRRAVDTLLHDDTVRTCEINVSRTAAGLRLALDVDGARLTDTEVAAA